MIEAIIEACEGGERSRARAAAGPWQLDGRALPALEPQTLKSVQRLRVGCFLPLRFETWLAHVAPLHVHTSAAAQVCNTARAALPCRLASLCMPASWGANTIRLPAKAIDATAPRYPNASGSLQPEQCANARRTQGLTKMILCNPVFSLCLNTNSVAGLVRRSWPPPPSPAWLLCRDCAAADKCISHL